MALAEIVTAITALITFFKGIRSTYGWGRKVLSIEWQKQYVNYVDYLEGVERQVTPYKNWSKTSIKGGHLQLLEGELKEAWSFVHGWMNKIAPHKQLTSDDFIKKLQTSRTTIAHNFQLFLAAVQTREQATQHIDRGTKFNVTHLTLINCNISVQNLYIGSSAAQPLRMENGNQNRSLMKNEQPYNGHPLLIENGKQNLMKNGQPYNGHRSLENGNRNIYIPNLNLIGCSAAQPLRIENESGKVHLPDHTRTNVEKMKQEKEREVTEYKAWLKKNITRLTDSWTSNKTGWKGATNSKLDLAKKERLFRNHVNELHKQYLREYSQLLKEVITQDLEIKYLELWSCAKSLMVRRERFRLLPEPEMEGEWRRHVEQISKKKGTSREN